MFVLAKNTSETEEYLDTENLLQTFYSLLYSPQFPGGNT